MNVNGTAKSGLAEDDFLLGSGPVLRPATEEFQLAVTEEFEPFDIDGFTVVLGIVDMVGARSHFWNRSFWTSFELAVFEDRKRDAGVGEVGKIDADIAFDGL